MHLESLSKFTSVNGSHSEGKSRKLLTENGDCSFYDGLPCYKRRKVSAVRDFPAGCGWSVPRIVLTQNVDSGCLNAVEGSFCGDKRGDDLGVDSVRTSNLKVKSENSDVLRSSVPNDMIGKTKDLKLYKEDLVFSSDQVDKPSIIDETANVQSLEYLEALNDAGLTRTAKVAEQETSDMSKDLHEVGTSSSKVVLPSGSKFRTPPDFTSVCSCNGMEKAVAERYPPRRRISAIRDFPLLCGRNTPRISKDECLLVLSHLKSRSLGQQNPVADDKPSREITEADLKEKGKDADDGGALEGVLGENISRLTMLEETFRVNSEGKATEEVKKQDVFGLSSEMKSAQEEVLRRKFSDVSSRQHHSQEDFEGLEVASAKMIVKGLMSESGCPWREGKTPGRLDVAGGSGTNQSKGKKVEILERLEKSKSVIKTKDVENHSRRMSVKKNKPIKETTACQGTSQLVIWDKEDSLESGGKIEDFYVSQRSSNFNVNLPPFGHSSFSGQGHDSDSNVTRIKVRETLRLFQAVSRKLLQEEEAKLKDRGRKRIDLDAAKILKDKNKYINTGKQIMGSVPGVEVGDEFHYRVELNIIGLHRPIQGGIDYLKQGGKVLATSVVASGGYADDLDNSDVLTYTGQGGNVMNTDKEPEDQKLERGNLAMKNSSEEKNHVRVIRGSESKDGKSKTYVYDGLYIVEKYWRELGPHGKMVFKFLLHRVPGQPELAWKEVKKSKKFKIREGLCVQDISHGKELIPIFAVNTIDDDKPPPFTYVTSMIYPDWCNTIPPMGCNCY
ncbi:histone-lysine N-methyltransferase, H3 lysine-9 specific SUVH6-like [Quillaja saponaria]|uniref:Histone-lysine N-methyltransferase, H3 lysine-9 specific SUVH6-like n=1 Tax=Quillaja saponaria TaxID=32244 RepID=A0AAD7KRU6_QUISA|nr:histone-lysine N-methyltransferase, H3 lysine-9 specific SUVH6-like [Quillaja saponaria]